MLRTLNLAKRSSLILMVAGSLATADLRAQHPIVSATTDLVGEDITFALSNPTPVTGQNDTRHAFLATYFSLEGNGGGLSNLLKKSLGAVAPYSSTASGMPAFAIPNANTTTQDAIPTGEFTVPPAIIAHAINDVDWAHYGEFMHTFAGTMDWQADGLGGANLGTGLDWPAFATGLVIPQTTFSTKQLAQALVARQIGYVENLPATDVTVVTRAKAVVEMCALDTQQVSFNTVLVEVQELPSNGEPVKIKLSRSHKITMVLPGAGSGDRKTYHWNYVYPIEQSMFFEVEMSETDFNPGGTYEIFVPTTAGYQAVPAEIRMDGATPILGGQLFGTMIAGPFSVFNLARMDYEFMKGFTGDTLINHMHLSLYSPAFVPLPMPTQGTN